jgi:hypothetical protein
MGFHVIWMGPINFFAMITFSRSSWAWIRVWHFLTTFILVYTFSFYYLIYYHNLKKKYPLNRFSQIFKKNKNKKIVAFFLILPIFIPSYQCHIFFYAFPVYTPLTIVQVFKCLFYPYRNIKQLFKKSKVYFIL